jgi:hypothetical protein
MALINNEYNSIEITNPGPKTQQIIVGIRS